MNNIESHDISGWAAKAAILKHDNARLRSELERIAWHDLTWKEAQAVARQALAHQREREKG